MQPTAIAAANVKVTEALNIAEAKQSANRACGTHIHFSCQLAQKCKVGKKATKFGVTATIYHYENIYKDPDLVLKESSVCRFKNACQERIKLNID